jgi:hypothetical protein
MLKRFSFILFFLLVSILGWEQARTSSGGIAGSYSSAPGESNCSSCHAGLALNAGPATRTLSLNGVAGATNYVPGQTYNVQFTMTEAGRNRFGFQLVARNASNQTAGTLIASEPTRAQMVQTQRLSHTSGGNSGSGTITWNFQWTAPVAGTGVVRFYVSSNATNSNGSTNGDNTYTNTFTLQEAPPVVNRQVTFRVNMSGLTVAASGVHISGSFQTSGAAPVAMAASTTIPNTYIYSVAIPNGQSVSYRFHNGSSASNVETVPSSCGVAGAQGVIFRSHSVQNDTVLPAFYFGTCYSNLNPPPPPVTRTVRFQVNMVGQTIAAQGVYLMGSFQGNNPASTRMTALSGQPNIYVFDTALVLGDTLRFRYVNGNTLVQAETVPTACASNQNRIHVLTDDVVLPAFLIGTCDTSPPLVPGRITGFVRYDNSTQTPMTNTTVRLLQNQQIIETQTTDANGSFTFDQVANGSYTLGFSTSKPWGGITATDALLTARHASFVSQLSGLRLKAADVNNSNTVNNTDALQISRRQSSVITSFSAGDWVFDQVALAVQSDTQQLVVKALCVGDVNGSNTPNINLRSTQLLMKSDHALISRSTDGLILYPISTMTSVEVGSVSYEAQLPAGVQVVGVDWPKGSTTSDGIYHQEGQILRVSWFDPLGVKVNEGESVLTFRLKIQDLEYVGLEMIDPVVRFVEWSNVEGTLYDVLNLRIPGTRNPKETTPRVYPQPATDRVVIEITGLEFGGRLILRNGLGQVVPISFSNTASASSQIFEADVSGLVGGIYTWEVVCAEPKIVDHKSGRLIIR